MKPLQTRKQKVRLLQDLHSGKTPLQDVLEPVYGVLFIKEGKVFARQDKDGYKDLNDEIDVETYAAQHAGTYSHVVEFVDFSKPIENNNKKQ